MFRSIFLLVLLVNFKLSSTAPVNTELQLVQILFRHGDRSPVGSYPTDLYNETTWAKYGGYGQLTQTGMEQHNEFGKFLRERYSGLLDKFYNKNNVVIRSTDFDRTLMSAYSLLSGLFTPVDYQEWSKNILWQPIAVHTTDANNDMVFYSRKCPRLLQLKNEVLRTTEYKALNSKYQPLFDVIDKYGGFKNMNLMDLWQIGDALFVEKTHSLPLPDWVAPYYDQMMEAVKWGWYFDYRLTEMGKLTSGGILYDMRKNFQSKIQNQTPNQLFLYSGHDTYVAGLVKLLGLTSDLVQPPYASAVVLELRKQVNSESYFVQAYYKNNSATEPISFNLLTINGCDTLCPFNKFIDIIGNLVVNDFSSACQIAQF